MGIKEDTEFTRQCGLRTIEQAKKAPGCKIRWALSNTHEEIDVCDQYAHGGVNGDGVYSPDECPPYPAHEGCKCCLILEPRPVSDILEWHKNPASHPDLEEWFQKNKDNL
ncbi:hypothetical protein [Selenomonas ruminantium]|uniref:Phage Mu protein F like protein n=1 Tax=Selenomonas ruminantium TaxID=971 RepID=A0A1H0MXV6_SELRU|nr:hypothetical protein [Selenomonas ruminantium]SDO85299.1 hypothetical protein SAMN05216366_10292 [Selenomonas ruminantium]